MEVLIKIMDHIRIQGNESWKKGSKAQKPP